MKTIVSKGLIGLMFKKKFEHQLLIKKSFLININTIHTAFMLFDIDIYFLNKNKQIIDKQTLKPFKSYKTKTKPEYVIETKKGLLNKQLNDFIDF
jgi:uncharacterized protein